MADVTVYGPPQSTYLRTVRMALEEKGVAYDLEPVEFGSDAHRALHPFLKVPAFKHGDVHLYETAAISYYVSATFDGTSLTPSDVMGRAKMLGWISAIIDYIYPTGVVDIVIERVAVPARGGTSDEDKIVAAKPKLAEQLGVVNAALGASSYLAGDELSLADLYLAPIVFYLKGIPDGEEPLAGKDNIDAWFNRIAARDSFAKTIPPMPQQQAAQ